MFEAFAKASIVKIKVRTINRPVLRLACWLHYGFSFVSFAGSILQIEPVCQKGKYELK
jgi:hypothetical protein